MPQRRGLFPDEPGGLSGFPDEAPPRGLSGFPEEEPPRALSPYPDEAPSGAPDGRRGLFPDDDDPATDDPRNQHLRQVLAVARRTPPDPEGERIFKLRLKTGLPEAVIRRNLAQVERDAARRDFDPETFRRQSPELADWLADPAHAALAHDDLAPLSALERTLQVAANSVRAVGAGALRFNVGAWGLLQAGSDAVGLASVADFARRAGAQASDLSSATRGPQAGAGDVERAFYSGFESLGLTATGLPLAVAGGGAPALLGVLGGVTGGESYVEARTRGVSVPQALVYGLSQGAIEVATEKIPASWLLRDPVDLLRAIAAAGGLGPESTGGLTGEPPG
jgi:hypothetical protein